MNDFPNENSFPIIAEEGLGKGKVQGSSNCGKYPKEP
jgi:hypothetical protein